MRLKTRLFVAASFVLMAVLLPYRTDVLADAPKPVLFYLELHVEAVIRNRAEYELETSLLKRLAGILEKHGARGSFMLLDIYPRMVKTYEPGPVNTITTLEKNGHEIGAHYHLAGGAGEASTIASTLHDIRSVGARSVQSLTASFQWEPFLDVEICSFDPAKKTAQLKQMVDDMYAGGITSAFRWCMEDMSPYRPRKDNWITANWSDCRKETKNSDPEGNILAVGMFDNAGYTFGEKDDSFEDIVRRIDRVMPAFHSGGVRYYPVAIHDYYFLNPSRAETFNRVVAINEERLKAFDRFLGIVDGYVKRGSFRYATRTDVTRTFSAAEKTAHTGIETDARINLFYVIHVHSGAEFRPEFEPLSREEFEGTVRALDTIGRTLEAHGAKGTFQIMQNFADAVRNFQGRERNILKELESRGHEIGAHVHTDRFNQWQKTRDAILSAGIKGITSISGAKLTALPPHEAFRRLAELGFMVETGNNSPLDLFPMKGMNEAKLWGFAENQAYTTAGTFIYPWLPDYEGNVISRNNPAGKVLYLDTVPPNAWRGGTGALAASDFERLEQFFTGALTTLGGSSGARLFMTWGFATHETEYQVDHNGIFKPANLPLPEAVRSLDDFLTTADRYKDKIRWSTPREIFARFRDWAGTRHE